MKKPQKALQNRILILFLPLLINTIIILVLVAALDPSNKVKASKDLSDANLSAVLESHPYSTSADDLFPNCRYGVASTSNGFDFVSHLGAGWHLGFGTLKTPYGPGEAEFVQMVRLLQGKDQRDGSNNCRIDPSYTYTITPPLTEEGLGETVDANPGALWIIGNEPDRIKAQDDICPQQYAQAYHEAYHFIKERDPTAQVGIAGLVEVTPARLQYLDIVWDTYLSQYGVTIPVDVWTMHIYILPEGPEERGAAAALGTDVGLARPLCSLSSPPCYRYADHDRIDLFQEHVIAMRTWMKQHGQQNKPLIMTEYSLLYPFEDYDDPINPTTCYLQDEDGGCFTAPRVANYMLQTFTYLESATDLNLGYPADEYRLVQQWLWYSLFTDSLIGKVSNLITSTTPLTLTYIGHVWQNYVSNIPAEANFFPAYVPTVKEYTGGSATATATLSVEIWNNGNFAPTDAVTVTFYTNQSLTNSIGSTTFSNLGGCTRHQVTVTTTWEALSAGYHPFWVKVDSAGTIAETNEADNVTSGAVFIDPSVIYLPTVMRNW